MDAVVECLVGGVRSVGEIGEKSSKYERVLNHVKSTGIPNQARIYRLK